MDSIQESILFIIDGRCVDQLVMIHMEPLVPLSNILSSVQSQSMSQ